jgi:hypothetical protein
MPPLSVLVAFVPECLHPHVASRAMREASASAATSRVGLGAAFVLRGVVRVAWAGDASPLDDA